jgi:hypothetical protein
MWKEAVMALHWHLSGGTEVNLKVSDLREDLSQMNQQFYPLEPHFSPETGVGTLRPVGRSKRVRASSPARRAYKSIFNLYTFLSYVFLQQCSHSFLHRNVTSLFQMILKLIHNYYAH